MTGHTNPFGDPFPGRIQVVKTIASLDRLRNSASGNPRWRVHFTDGTRADTGPDATVGFEIDHEAWQKRPVVFSMEDDYVVDIAHPITAGGSPAGAYTMKGVQP